MYLCDNVCAIFIMCEIMLECGCVYKFVNVCMCVCVYARVCVSVRGKVYACI